MADTNFGINQVGKTTPIWAKKMFYITFIVTSAITGYIAATNLVPENTKYEITLFLKLMVDPIVLGISRMFGVNVKDDEQ